MSAHIALGVNLLQLVSSLQQAEHYRALQAELDGITQRRYAHVGDYPRAACIRIELQRIEEGL
jgi:hypothetical protein